MKSGASKLFYLIAVGAIIIAGIFLLRKDSEIELSAETDTGEKTAAVAETVDPTNGELEPLPKTFMIDIPFTVQAPLADWSWPFNHSCEEASVLMAHLYLSKKTLAPEKAQAEILAMNEYEKQNYQLANVSAARQTAILVNDYYGYDAKAYFKISLDDIKRELVSGNLVLVPTHGQRLQNPYFKTPGPIYHMLVIKGWTPTEFIVNDPGTKRGADFRYSYKILENAISDWDLESWDTAVNINDRKAMIVIKK